MLLRSVTAALMIGTVSAQRDKAAARTVPIVFALAGDPGASGRADEVIR